MFSQVIKDNDIKAVRAVRLGYCFTPYQRLWLYNGAPLVAFYDTLGIRRTNSRLKPPASSRGGTCGTTTSTGIYRSLCRPTDSSVRSSGRVAFVLFLQQLGSRDTSAQVRVGKLKKKKQWQHSEECMCRLGNIALESVTEKCDRRTDRRRIKWSLCVAMLRRRHKNDIFRSTSEATMLSRRRS